MPDFSTHTDQELLDLLKERNKAAFTALYERYAAKIYYQVNQLLRDPVSAKDVVQELFIVIWNKADHINAKGNFAGYLYIAAQNTTLKHMRKGRLQIDYLESLGELADVLQDEADAEYDVEALHALIRQEIDRLPEKMKLIFELSRRGDLSYKDIAAELGIAENTVRKQVSNALKLIRTNVDVKGSSTLIAILLLRE